MLRKRSLLVFLFFTLTFFSQKALAAEIAWNDCVTCHTGHAEGVRAPSVDLAVLESSVHAGIKCLDCHSDIHEVEHVVGDVPHQRHPARVSCTDRCHVKGNAMGAPDFSPMEQYKDSVHGRASQVGVAEAASCADCHGRHNIRRKDDPESSIYRANIPRTCAVCHADMQVVLRHHIHAEKPFQEYEQSVHGKALYRDGLIQVAAVCTDCHGVHDIQAAGTPDIRSRRPETCGKCHIGVLVVYRESVHGKAAMEEHNPDAPVCADCHGEHRISTPSEAQIEAICSKCHAEEGLMTKYEIPVDRSATYAQTYHGIASSYGSKTVANCASCHGYHDVRPPTDPKSSVYPGNLVSTCGKPKCHPGISANVASAKIHVDVKKKEAGGVYYVRRVLVWTFVALLLLTFIWVVPDIARRIRRRGEK
jgi:DnaJ-class molecular chaperone